MYTVNRIYIEQRSSIDVYKPDEITPSELSNHSGINVKLFVSVLNEDTKKSVALDYGRLFTDHVATEVDTWEEFNSKLTDGLVIGYTVTLPGYIPGTITPRNPIKLWDAMSTINTFNIDYCDYLTGKSNIFVFRWKLKDLGLSIMDDALNYPNLSKCVPIVNGFVCRPVYRKEDQKLYALDGAHLCWHNGLHTTPEIQLLDFTDLGEIKCEPIHATNHSTDSCTYVYSRDGAYNFSLVNNNYSLYEWTPIIVICGVMIFPDEYNIKGEYKIDLDLDRFPFNKALALKKFLQNEPNSSSGVGYTTDDPKLYILDQFGADISGDTFVIYVKTPNLCVSRTHLTSWRHNITVDLNTNEGILINDATHTVRNYHKDTLPDRKELTIQTYENIFVADNNFNTNQISFSRPDCRHHNFEDLNRSANTMVFLLGGNND